VAVRQKQEAGVGGDVKGLFGEAEERTVHIGLRSQVSSHRSQVTSLRSQVTSHRSQVSGHKSQVTDLKPATCDKF
jgi:hypothetical protein